jgi:hypothetical protein
VITLSPVVGYQLRVTTIITIKRKSAEVSIQHGTSDALAIAIEKYCTF